jgi:hypothetical protein
MTWDERRLSPLLARASREQGRLLGKMEGLGFALRREAHLLTLTEDVVKSSEIEGEKLDSAQVGYGRQAEDPLPSAACEPGAQRGEGVFAMVREARRH